MLPSTKVYSERDKLKKENKELKAELERLREIEKAAQAIKDTFSFLSGKPGQDFGGQWVPFVEALARSRTSEVQDVNE